MFLLNKLKNKIKLNKINKILYSKYNQSNKIKSKYKFNNNSNDLFNKIKNPQTKTGRILKAIGISVGICCIGMIASLIGLR